MLALRAYPKSPLIECVAYRNQDFSDRLLALCFDVMSKLEIMGEILEVLKEHKTFLISSHINPDGDAVGSQLALCSVLSDLGKTVFVVNSDPVPPVYNFLPDFEVFCTESTIQNVEVAIILDCGSLNRIGEELAARIRPSQALINIDHHNGNDQFGTHNLVDVGACAAAELVFDLLEYGDIEIGRDRAICLYTGILTDTGSFKYGNTTAKAHRIAARLIDEGVSPDRIAELIYEIIPYQRAKLFAMALETLQLSSDGKIAWMSVTQEMHRQTGTGSLDTTDFIDYARCLKDTEVVAFFRELQNGDIKISLRSKTGLCVDQVAAMFGGGGHKAAAGCTISEPLDKAISMILEAVITDN